MSHVEDSEKWIKRMMSKVIERLGSNVDEARYELSKRMSYCMSILYYISVKFNNGTKQNKSEEISMILKRSKAEEYLRQMFNVDAQFHNEIVFYGMYVQDNDHIPRCFYACEEVPPIDSVIVLEDVTKRGYSPYPFLCDAPLEYTLAAMREMGRFHGKGYVMKELQREKFFDIVNRIQETRYINEENEYRYFIDINVFRAVDYLRSHGYDSVFCDKIEALFSNTYEEIMLKIAEPLEPLSVLCHGDFMLSNILFKTEDDGQYRGMLIDFALLRYGTPVIDLSTYLCCCSNEIRKDRFFEIIRAYHDALKEYLLEAKLSNIEKYSYDAFLNEFRRCGLFGYVIASFYLPVLMGFKRDLNSPDLCKFMESTTPAERATLVKQCGGDKISKILADMLLHLRDLGCLKYFSYDA